MSQRRPRGIRLLRELRRRNIFRVAFLYGAVAWVLVEAADLLVPSLGLPPWAVTLVVVLALSGLPVALVAAWAYELAPVEPRAESTPPATVAEAGHGRAARETDEEPSIGVLPFVELSGGLDPGYLGDGIAEEILTALAAVPGLRVPARTSCFAFKHRNEDARRIGEALGVATLLEGSVQTVADRIRITVELIDARTGYHLWSEQYDRRSADVFAVQEEIASTVLLRLGFTARDGASHRVVRAPTRDIEAYHWFLKGRAFFYRRGRHLSAAISCYRRALELDATFAEVHAGLSVSYSMLGHYGYVRPEAAMPEAASRARAALALDETLPAGHCAHGIVALLYQWDSTAAERAFRKAVELHPTYVQARCWSGLFCQAYVLQDYEAALAEVDAAVDADPLSAYVAACKAFVLAAADRHEEAEAWSNAAAHRDPGAYLPSFARAVSRCWAGEWEAAVASAEAALAVSGRHWWALGQLAVACAGAGRTAEASAIRAEFVARGAREYAQPTWQAIATLAAGDREGALRQLERAVRERDPYLVIALTGWKDLETLRHTDRFRSILRQVVGS